jgi:hypothetical protein
MHPGFLADSAVPAARVDENFSCHCPSAVLLKRRFLASEVVANVGYASCSGNAADHDRSLRYVPCEANMKRYFKLLLAKVASFRGLMMPYDKCVLRIIQNFGCAAIAALILFTFASVASTTDGATYTATVIPAVALSGGSVQVRIQITAYTSDAERKQLKDVFSKEGSDKGLEMLRTMTKGYINIAGQAGRKIMAAFTLDRQEGKRLILITEHVLSAYEKQQGERAEDYPLTIIHIQFDTMGHPKSGEVYPAARLSVTKDGFVDVNTQATNTATLIDIIRTN